MVAVCLGLILMLGVLYCLERTSRAVAAADTVQVIYTGGAAVILFLIAMLVILI